jgi:hypothetical protein
MIEPAQQIKFFMDDLPLDARQAFEALVKRRRRPPAENQLDAIQTVPDLECEIGVISAEEFKSFLQQFPVAYRAIARILGCELHNVYAKLGQRPEIRL